MTTKTERILTLHPDGKQGVNIERNKYDAMQRAILRVIPKREPGVRFGELCDLVRPHLAASDFPPTASVGWYMTTVKLDLEARGQLQRLPGRGPQRLVRGAGTR